MNYGVRYSAHGSQFRFDSFPDGNLYRYTLEEANTLGLDWESRADTVGGKAEIVREDGIVLQVVDTYNNKLNSQPCVWCLNVIPCKCPMQKYRDIEAKRTHKGWY